MEELCFLMVTHESASYAAEGSTGTNILLLKNFFTCYIVGQQ